MTRLTPEDTRDWAGARIGKLRAIQRVAPYGRRHHVWRCECDCGGKIEISSARLLAKSIKASAAHCGCCSRGTKPERHGMAGTPEYRAWAAMRMRCVNPNMEHWDSYGGRGITVCAKWLNSFGAFYQDMGPRPTSKHSLDRIDNDGNYEPSNCRWATGCQQSSNKRPARIGMRSANWRATPARMQIIMRRRDRLQLGSKKPAGRVGFIDPSWFMSLPG